MKLHERLAESFAVDNEGNSEGGYVCGFLKGLELAVNRVRYSRFSIVLSNDDYTRGYIQACKDIEERIKELENEES